MFWTNCHKAMGFMFAAALVLSQPLSARADGPISVQPSMTVQENGRGLRCHIISAWTLPNGLRAYLVQVQATGEFLTLAQDRRASGSLPPGSVPMQIYHWGKSNISPAGAPIPPSIPIADQIRAQLGNNKETIEYREDTPNGPGRLVGVVPAGSQYVPAPVPIPLPPAQPANGGVKPAAYTVPTTTSPNSTPPPSFPSVPANPAASPYLPGSSFNPKLVANPAPTTPSFRLVSNVAEPRTPVPVLVPRACVCTATPMTTVYPPSRQTMAAVCTNCKELSTPGARTPTIVLYDKSRPAQKDPNEIVWVTAKNPPATVYTPPKRYSPPAPVASAKSEPYKFDVKPTPPVAEKAKSNTPIRDFFFGAAKAPASASADVKPVSPPARSPFTPIGPTQTANGTPSPAPRTITTAPNNAAASNLLPDLKKPAPTQIASTQDPFAPSESAKSKYSFPVLPPSRTDTAQTAPNPVFPTQPSTSAKPRWDPPLLAQTSTNRSQGSDFATLRPDASTPSAIRQVGGIDPTPARSTPDPFSPAASAKNNSFPTQPPVQLAQNTASTSDLEPLTPAEKAAAAAKAEFDGTATPHAPAPSGSPAAKSGDSGFLGGLFGKSKDPVPTLADPVPYDPNSANAAFKASSFPVASGSATGAAPGQPYSTASLAPAPGKTSSFPAYPNLALPPNSRMQTVSALMAPPSAATPTASRTPAIPVSLPAGAAPPTDTTPDWHNEWGRPDDPLAHPERYDPDPKTLLPKQPTVAASTGTRAPQANAMTLPGVPTPTSPLAGQVRVAQASPLPPGGASVAAAYNGAQMFYVPVPTRTTPDLTRMPNPPPPRIPEPPAVNTFSNAFSPPSANLPPVTTGGSDAYSRAQLVNPALLAQIYAANPFLVNPVLLQQGIQNFGLLPPQQRDLVQQALMVQHQTVLQQSQAMYLQQQQLMTGRPGAPNAYPVSYPMPNPVMLPGPAPGAMPTPYAPVPAPAPAPGVQPVDHRSEWQSGPNVQPLLRTLTESTYPAEREAAANSLASFQVGNPQVLQALLQAARQDPAVSVRVGCVHALARMNVAAEPDVLTTLRGLKNDPDPKVRSEVADACQRLKLNP